MAILNDLIVTGPSKQLGPVGMSDSLVVQGCFTAGDDSVIDGLLEVSGSLSVDGGAQFGDVVSFASEVYGDDYTTAALKLNNSNIVGINSLYFADASEGASEGINFYKDSSTVHTLWITSGGTLIYEPNRPLGGTGTTALSVSNTGVLATRSLVISATNGGTTTASINSSGQVTAASYNATSDKRLKENIVDYKLPTAKSILKLPIKKFDFIDGPKNQIGCIAQDLQEICPELVQSNNDGYLSIQESKLVYLVIDELKKLRNEFEEYKKTHP